MVFFGYPKDIECDEVHISVAFTYDIPKAEYLAKLWSHLGAPVKVGGPAYGQRDGDFTPGLYLKKGYTITSRGCLHRKRDLRDSKAAG